MHISKSPFIVVWAMLILADTAWSQSPDPTEGQTVGHQARLLLGAVDIQLTPQRLEALGLTFEEAASVAMDTEARLYLRVRGVSAAAMLEKEAAHTFLVHLASSNDHIEVRRQAIISLSKIFGRKSPRRISAELTALWHDCPPILQNRIEREKVWLAQLMPDSDELEQIPVPNTGVTRP